MHVLPACALFDAYTQLIHYFVLKRMQAFLLNTIQMQALLYTHMPSWFIDPVYKN